jgi:serine/threonine protein phosphatase 1
LEKKPVMSLTYAIGDIHGLKPELDALLARCRRHAAGRAATLIFLGDYIDRGPASAAVVAMLMELQARGPEPVIALKGNHEAVLLDVVAGAVAPDRWMTQGGPATLASYGVDDVRDVPQAHLDWMRALPAKFDDGKRLFVHAGVDPQRSLPAQRDHDLIWIREPFLSDTSDFGRLVVHGHTPTKGAPDLRSNRLNIDTGAVYGGPLTAAVFTDEAVAPVEFLQVP